MWWISYKIINIFKIRKSIFNVYKMWNKWSSKVVQNLIFLFLEKSFSLEKVWGLSNLPTSQWFEASMSEIEFLTYPVRFKGTERDLKKYDSQSISSHSIKKYCSHWFNKKYCSVTGPDRWWQRSIIQSCSSH